MTTAPNHDPARLLADHGFVRSLAHKLCRDIELAEDVAQDAMVAAIRAPTDEARNWRGWLASVTRHLVLNHRRGERRRKAREQAASSPKSTASPAEIVAEEQLRANVVKAVLTLPEPFRDVVLLRHYRGMDTRSCAQHLDIPEATVRTRLKRGIEQLRGLLDEQHGGDRRQWVTALLPLAWPAPRAAVAGSQVLLWLAAAGLVAIAIGTPLWWRAQQPVAVPAGTATTATAATASTADDDDRTSGAADSQTARIAKAPVRPRRIVGTASDGQTGQPLANARISMSASLPDGGESLRTSLGAAVTDEAGAFELPLAALADLPGDVIRRMDLAYHLDAVGYRPMDDNTGLQEMRPDGTMFLALDLQPSILTKGRIVDSMGQPIPGANLLVLSEDSNSRRTAEPSGTFAFDLPPRGSSARDFTLIAVDNGHGFSQPVRVRVDPSRETHVGDLAILQPLGQIEGIVKDRNGRGVPGIQIKASASNSYAPHEVQGIVIPELGGLLGRRFARTDANGRFAFRALPLGRHRVQGPKDTQEVELTSLQPVHIAFEWPTARIDLRTTDEHGLPLDSVYQGIYVWHGDQAWQAHNRYQQEGLSAELVATATETGWQALSGFQPPAFAIAEAMWIGFGPAAGTCYLPPGQYRGEITLQRQQPGVTGSLQIHATHADGTRARFLAAKACRLPGRQSVPIVLGNCIGDPGVTGRFFPGSQIQGRWHRVASGGTLTGLPVGELSIEVLIEPEILRGQVVGCTNHLITRRVVVRPDETIQMAVVGERGCLPEIQIQVPQLGENEKLDYVTLDVVFRRLEDGKEFARTLEPLHGLGVPQPKNGTIHGRCTHAVPPGEYSVRSGPLLIEVRNPTGRASRNQSRFASCPPVEVATCEAMQPIILKLKGK